MDDIVWVNLGSSYGWWPGQVQDSSKKPVLPTDIFTEGQDDNCASELSDTQHVKFFDDDKFDWYSVSDPTRIRPYSGKHKMKLIKDGVKKFKE